jgi:hypothetical protein
MNSNLVQIESATENAFIEGELKIIHSHGTLLPSKLLVFVKERNSTKSH